jgi:hypothetical protein
MIYEAFTNLNPMSPLASPLTEFSSMSQPITQGANGSDLVRKSSLYREFEAEKEEIMKHKWIESQKAGHDIGFERALTDWIIKHRSKWRRSRQQPQNSSTS